MPGYRAVISLRIYEGDGVWKESVDDGLLTRTQIVNDAVLELLGYCFGSRPDWFSQSIAHWQATGSEDASELTADITVHSEQDQADLIADAMQVFHHDVTRIQEFAEIPVRKVV